ncbi:MAG: 30S ribosomal protein S2 [Candidatus Krumholzibacteria bacterium]|nr:30S ribosomal protein S2 [Candidatus Krumholzibacteria bacterium]MDH4336208.1 30S ribosomal protein S2 [Candidatus Krumholzibacteria bacterium]MDH5268849.1 30S ribosomal protein S2 [Candidatus Krumholzibacteria bacterium]
MGDVTLQELLEAGVHFGHQTKRWNPKMKPFLFTEKNGIHIIDLEKSLECIVRARDAIREVSLQGRMVLFVGTKPQAKFAICEEAMRCGMPYVTERWLGGTLTNFNTVRKSLGRLEYLEKIELDGTISQFSKKEASGLAKEKERILKTLGGVRKLTDLPGMVFIVDTKKEQNAVNEARRLSIPIVGVVDSNADPDEVDYPIPGNDDAMRAVGLFAKIVADACIEGRARYSEGRDISTGDEPATDEAGSKSVA